jgi:hypothetical protein
MLFFSTWLDLIDLFFCWPHFVSFGSFESYVGIIFVGKKRHFSILFGFPLRVWKRSKEKSKYYLFIFGYPFSSSIEDALTVCVFDIVVWNIYFLKCIKIYFFKFFIFNINTSKLSKILKNHQFNIF